MKRGVHFVFMGKANCDIYIYINITKVVIEIYYLPIHRIMVQLSRLLIKWVRKELGKILVCYG